MNLANLMIANQVSSTTDETLSLAEKAIEGIQVVAIGMGVVFGVLILLIGILQIFKLFALKKPKEEKSISTEAPAPVAVPTTPMAAQPVTVSASASEEEAVVAIATAAIAASRGESECAFNVISIKKIVK